MNLSRLGQVIFVGISLSFLMIGNAWSQEAIEPKIQPYIEELTDEIEENNQEASRKLKEEIGIDGMIKALESDNQELRFAILEAFGKIELGEKRKQVISVLINILKTDKDEEVRNYVTYSLADMGILAKDAIKPLIEAGKTDRSQLVRVGSIRALVKIAPSELETIQTLIDAQQDPNQYVRDLGIDYLSEVLINVDSDVLDKALKKVKVAVKKDNDWRIRLGAAEALGRSGRDVKLAVSTLEKVLKSSDEKLIQKNVINALRNIAENLSEYDVRLTPEERANAQEGLQKAIEILNQNQDDLKKSGENIEEVKSQLKNALTGINALQIAPTFYTAKDFAQKYPLIIGVIIIVIFWFPSIFFILWKRPLWLLKINNFLQSYTDIPLPNVLGGVKISTLRKLLFNLHYHPKVLDAWVKFHLETARKEFQKKSTVKERNIYIPIPVILDGQKIANLTGNNLKPYFTEQRECLLIWGEGGLGKTSLACQLAHWGMSENSEQYLCEHQMLPILLEEELDFPVAEGKEIFIEAIRGKLQDLIDSPEPIPEELLVQLLRKQRLLVIVDHLSEMKENTRKQIRPELPNFSVNALVITSRIKEKLGGVNRTILQPLQVENNQLLGFIDAYLTQQGKRNLFNDEDIIEARNKLSNIVGEKHITVLLVKLYMEQMITAKANQNLASLPSNVPDLMLDYLNSLNLNVKENKLENRMVQKNTKIIAWECLKQSYRPTTAERDAVLTALGGEQPEALLEYLEKRLQIIQTIGSSENKIRFSLDPIAEYMAALHIVELYGDNEQLWRDFLAGADAQPGEEKTIQGFLLTVQDCCLVQKEDLGIPGFVLEEFNKRVLNRP
ncbi:MAG: PBS lyase [Okeania sp. SIO3I5]|uniref:HEAT repeat domain-containing protein n=1 Tax=Okeania sp. SIO3I5 TaxID=2607805 RepID=UPI0013BC782B|nr:HEAT repeat domain-containing protein [Okeania sp. SIO3I5]NEQ38674.1 PBS lyase [Okeania sp. SIO3I5]